MNVKFSIAAGALLVSSSLAATPVWAQGGPEQTSEDLICQLSDSCVEAVDDEAGDASIEPTAPAVPGARVSATRGFKIANKVTAPPESKAEAAATRPRAQVVTTKPKRLVVPGNGTKTAAVKAPGSGRADLRVSFVTGSSDLTEAGQREAHKFAEALRSPVLDGMRFRIEGHTDAVGNRDYNIDLSRRRAQSVVDYLVGKGADRTRFDVVGYGFDKPLQGQSANAAANRRVEVVRIK